MQKQPVVITKVAEAGGMTNIAVPSVAVAELRYGVEMLPEGRKKRERIASLDTVFDNTLEILPFTEGVAVAFGWAGALLKDAGVAFSFPDLAIASVALAEYRTLASNDRFFEYVQRICGLSFERWEP